MMIPTRLPSAGLYAITDTNACAARGVVECVRLAIAGGAQLVQYRDKSRDHGRREQEATALLGLCREHGVPLIINDDVSLARHVGADGVHLGRDDADVTQARRALGPRALVGVSCYHEYERARSAVQAGASYVAFGRFFSSLTKPGRPLARPQLLGQASRDLGVPVAAIGGIDSSNGAGLIAAGAGLLACIQSVFGQADIAAAARAIQGLFADSSPG